VGVWLPSWSLICEERKGWSSERSFELVVSV